MKHRKPLSLWVVLILSCGLTVAYFAHYAWTYNVNGGYDIYYINCMSTHANGQANVWVCPNGPINANDPNDPNTQTGGDWCAITRGQIGSWITTEIHTQYNLTEGTKVLVQWVNNSNPPSYYTYAVNGSCTYMKL